MKVPGSLLDLENLIQRVKKKMNKTKTLSGKWYKSTVLFTDALESNGGIHRVYQIT